MCTVCAAYSSRSRGFEALDSTTQAPCKQEEGEAACAAQNRAPTASSHHRVRARCVRTESSSDPETELRLRLCPSSPSSSSQHTPNHIDRTFFTRTLCQNGGNGVAKGARKKKKRKGGKERERRARGSPRALARCRGGWLQCRQRDRREGERKTQRRQGALSRAAPRRRPLSLSPASPGALSSSLHPRPPPVFTPPWAWRRRQRPWPCRRRAPTAP